MIGLGVAVVRSDAGLIKLSLNTLPTMIQNGCSGKMVDGSPTPTGSGGGGVDHTFLIMYEHKGWVNPVNTVNTSIFEHF